jgi:magnesium transporter
MIYTGEHKDVPTSITHYAYNQDKVNKSNDWKMDEKLKHYIQVVGISDISSIEAIKELFPIDQLVLEDIFNVNQRTKIEWKGSYIFAVLNLEFIEQGEIIDGYFSLIMFENTLITFHETKPQFLDPISKLFDEHKELRERSIDYLLYQILDMITDYHLDIYDILEEQIIHFEESIIENENIKQDAFYQIRKTMLKLKGHVTPTFEQIDKILSRPIGLFKAENQPYFDDLMDHLQRLDNRINQSREQMRNLLDLDMNNQSTKMNKIMATLTLFSAIFIPLSFLTGFFGMNFIYFEILTYEHAVLIFSIICVIIMIVMIYFFKRKKWF